MAIAQMPRWHHGDAVPLADVPELSESEFRRTVVRDVGAGQKIVAFSAVRSPAAFA